MGVSAKKGGGGVWGVWGGGGLFRGERVSSGSEIGRERVSSGSGIGRERVSSGSGIEREQVSSESEMRIRGGDSGTTEGESEITMKEEEVLLGEGKMGEWL